MIEFEERNFFCKRFWENNKLLEFHGRSNKAGLFVVIVMFLVELGEVVL